MTDAARALALEFARALGARDYRRAYGLTSSEYRARVSLDDLEAAFETIVPPDWGSIEPIEVGMTLPDWPTKQPGDVLWIYVSIYGDVYAEALSVVAARDGNTVRVRDVEWGRP